MLTASEALAAILLETDPVEPERLPLADALGLALAADVAADADSPPFDKSLMDGFAVRAAEVAAGRSEWRVLEEVTAGQVPSRGLGEGETIHLMTGAPLPDGADAVIPVERVAVDPAAGVMRFAGPTAEIPGPPSGATPKADSRSWAGTPHPAGRPIEPGANIIRRGTVFRAGQIVLPAGTVLRPQELGVLAEVGAAQPLVRRRPRVAVLVTGDELVPIDATPGPGQIRNSNEIMLCAQLRRAGAEPVPLGIARDEPEQLRSRILTGLECDALILSGGVSAGTKDLVPAELERVGVRQVFHKVRLKPGTPLWLGVRDPQPGGPKRLVFGLPGNPVSSFVCCELFVRAALRRLMGIEPAEPLPIQARLGEGHVARGERPTYHPARLDREEDVQVVRTVRWHGSSDLRALLDANALAIFPAGDREWKPGERLDVLPLS